MNYVHYMHAKRAALLLCRLCVIQTGKGKLEEALRNLGRARALRWRLMTYQDRWVGQEGEV